MHDAESVKRVFQDLGRMPDLSVSGWCTAHHPTHSPPLGAMVSKAWVLWITLPEYKMHFYLV